MSGGDESDDDGMLGLSEDGSKGSGMTSLNLAGKRLDRTGRPNDPRPLELSAAVGPRSLDGPWVLATYWLVFVTVSAAVISIYSGRGWMGSCGCVTAKDSEIAELGPTVGSAS